MVRELPPSRTTNDRMIAPRLLQGETTYTFRWNSVAICTIWQPRHYFLPSKHRPVQTRGSPNPLKSAGSPWCWVEGRKGCDDGEDVAHRLASAEAMVPEYVEADVHR